jgi:hypothetical protein
LAGRVTNDSYHVRFCYSICLPFIFFSIANTERPGFFGGWEPIVVIFFVLAYLVFVFVVLVVTFALKVADFRIMRQKDRDVIGKDDYFFFLRKPYRSKTINLYLAYFRISLLAMLSCVFPLIYVLVLLNLLMVMYAFNPEVSSSNLIKVSFELGHKKWLITFGITLVASFLAQIVGVLICGIGILATASFEVIPLYLIYKGVIGFDEAADDLKQIGANINSDATMQ